MAMREKFAKIKKILEKVTGSKEEIKREIGKIYAIDTHVHGERIYKNNRSILLIVLMIGVFFTGMSMKNLYDEGKIVRQLKNGNIIIKRDDKVQRNIEVVGYGVDDRGKKFEKSVSMRILPSKDKERKKDRKENYTPEEEALKSRQLMKLVRKAEDDGKEYIVLPSNLPGGGRVYWALSQSKSWIWGMIFLICVLIAMRKTRFTSVKSLEKSAKENILRELPNFINKLILLLGAGIVFDNAFAMAIAGSMEGKMEKDSYFYRALDSILKETKNNNENAIDKLYQFAKSSGVRELVRVVNIIWDNINKGDKLNEKLQLEGELLWFAQKKSMEERGRLSEGKLIMPLLVMLLILVIITVAPAMLDM